MAFYVCQIGELADLNDVDAGSRARNLLDRRLLAVRWDEDGDHVLPEIKKIIRSISYEEAKEIARHALSFSTGMEVVHYLKSKYTEIVVHPKGKHK